MARPDEGPHFTPVFRRGAFAAWFWTVVATTVGCLPLVLTDGTFRDLIGIEPVAWAVVGVVAIGELRPLVASQRADTDSSNLATAFLFAVLLRWGIEPALLAVVVATMLGEVARAKRFYAAVFNVAQFGLSYVAAWTVLVAGGWQAAPSLPASLVPGDLPLILAAVAAYHVVNLLLVGTALAFRDGDPWWGSVTDNVWWYTKTKAAVFALSPLIVVVLDVDAVFLPLLLVPLWLVYTTAQQSLSHERQAQTDALTGVANRDALEHLVAERIDAATLRRPTALCVLDLDRFKEVNDTLGHAAGDALLQATAGRLTAGVRDSDAVIRLGGDEFVVLLTVEEGIDIVDAVHRLADRVQQPFDLGGVRLEIELSIGIAMVPLHGRDLDTLLRRADAAMYSAKANGDAVRVYGPHLDQQGQPRLELLADLRDAIDQGELELYYQPQVDVVDTAITGLEALVRWRHPSRGLLLPDDFLPLAHGTATTRLVTTEVLDIALRQQVAWRQLGLHVPVAINVSLHDLADEAFADRVVGRLREHHVPASALRIEITEDALLGDAERVLGTLRALRHAGIELSLDDFGTGQSSLTRLNQLPVAEVKIDGALIADMGPGSPAVAIVRSVVDLTRALGIRSVAEAVETEQHRDALLALGVDVAQGWLYAPALPADQATGLLLRRLDAARPDPSPVPAGELTGAPGGDPSGPALGPASDPATDGAADGVATASG